MSTPAGATRHRLDGLEPDNLLAFLALLGLLRTLEAVDHDRPEVERLHPRVAWSLDEPPLRPVLFLARAATRAQVAEAAARGVRELAVDYDFGGRLDLKYARDEARNVLVGAAATAGSRSRGRVDLLAALMSDAVCRDGKDTGDLIVDPTPLCLVSGSGHQHFLERLVAVASQESPRNDKAGRKTPSLSAADCISATLFQPWRRADLLTSSFRWDPDEDVRYALRAGDPSDNAYKAGTQHGANRLAAVGLREFTLAPAKRSGKVRASVVGGSYAADGFSLAWPIWSAPTTLPTIRALLGHPGLRKSGALDHLGVDHVVLARRVVRDEYKNFARARPIQTPARKLQ